MTYVVRFSDKSGRFELGAASLEAAHAIVTFLTNANALDVSVVPQLDLLQPDDIGRQTSIDPGSRLIDHRTK